jgi:hypothetical protein
MDFAHDDDEELAAAAFVLRTRAKHGDREAQAQAERLEEVLRSRLGATPSNHAPLERAPTTKRPWWRFW